MADFAPPRPLTEADDRESFDCGREVMDAWFRRHGWVNHRDGVSRVNVITETETNRIAGFVALSATQIERAFLPKSQQRNRPEALPAFLLGQLAVDRAYQGRRVAASLLQFAIVTAWRASTVMGSMGIVTHPIDESVRGFYAKCGFETLPFDPKRAMFVRMVDLEKLLGGSQAGH